MVFIKVSLEVLLPPYPSIDNKSYAPTVFRMTRLFGKGELCRGVCSLGTCLCSLGVRFQAYLNTVFEHGRSAKLNLVGVLLCRGEAPNNALSTIFIAKRCQCRSTPQCAAGGGAIDNHVT